MFKGIDKLDHFKHAISILYNIAVLKDNVLMDLYCAIFKNLGGDEEMPSFTIDDKQFGVMTLTVSSIGHNFDCNENIDMQIRNMNLTGGLFVVGFLPEGFIYFILNALKRKIDEARFYHDNSTEDFLIRLLATFIMEISQKDIRVNNKEEILSIINELDEKYFSMYQLRDATEIFRQNFANEELDYINQELPDDDSIDDYIDFVNEELDFNPEHYIIPDEDVVEVEGIQKDYTYKELIREEEEYENDGGNTKQVYKPQFAKNTPEYIPPKVNND